MGNTVRWLIAGLAATGILAACGGGGSSSSSSTSGSSVSAPVSGSNVLPVTVEELPSTAAYTVNMPYATVTVCSPGSSTDCVTVDHVLVDTGSYGLRILASALGSSLSLPAQTDAGGDAVVECVAFISGYMWGNVRMADVHLGEMTASSIPIQIVADAAAPTVPSACSSKGSAMDSVASFGANGILGVGALVEDCGSYCQDYSSNDTYYTCPGGTCGTVAVAVADQVINPVAALPTDNNGVVLVMPAVSSTGASTATGSLVFGIDTRSNNALGSATVFNLDTSANFRTTYGGSTITAFIDSGSNGLFFDDASIAVCSSTSGAPDFFCPPSTLTLSATIKAATGGQQKQIPFSIANAGTLVQSRNSAFNNLGAPWGGSPNSFDWGMPFFYGRSVYFGIEGNTISGNVAPFAAF